MKHFCLRLESCSVLGYALLTLFVVMGFSFCTNAPKTVQEPQRPSQRVTKAVHESMPYLVVLGNAQDAGSPQAACEKSCCQALWNTPDLSRKVSCLGLVDPRSGKRFLFDATPDIRTQLHDLRTLAAAQTDLPDGVFLTHAHVGHYTGLMQFGREAIGARNVPVYAMPRMDSFLKSDGPWSQLIDLSNISLQPLKENLPVQVAQDVRVTPFRVPHRDEYSETVGFKIEGPNRSALYIPDIDKWTKWEKQLANELLEVDYAFLDGTFFDQAELPGRDMSEIPHPFVIETMSVLEKLSPAEKAKIQFIHFNHTNALLDTSSVQYNEVLDAGFQVAKYLDIKQL